MLAFDSAIWLITLKKKKTNSIFIALYSEVEKLHENRLFHPETLFFYDAVLSHVTASQDVRHSCFPFTKGKQCKSWPSLLQQGLLECDTKQILQTNTV